MDRRSFVAGAAGFAVGSTFARADDSLLVRDLYEKDMSFTPLAKSLDGKQVTVSGFMAPPLKAESRFFVLTRRPMSICPFCDTEAEWPNDILAIYADRIVTVMPYNVNINVTGRMALGTYTDPELGFVSRVRILGANFRRV